MTTNYHPIIDRMKAILDLIDTMDPGGSTGNLIHESGTITVTSEDIINSSFTVPHSMGKIPFYAAIWNTSTTYSGNHVIGGQSMLIEEDNSPILYPDVARTTYAIAKECFYAENGTIIREINGGNYVKNFTDHSVDLTASSAYPVIPGTYNYSFIAFKEI